MPGMEAVLFCRKDVFAGKAGRLEEEGNANFQFSIFNFQCSMNKEYRSGRGKLISLPSYRLIYFCREERRQ